MHRECWWFIGVRATRAVYDRIFFSVLTIGLCENQYGLISGSEESKMRAVRDYTRAILLVTFHA